MAGHNIDHDHSGTGSGAKLSAANTHESPSADTHHARSHDHGTAGDGTALSPVTLNLPATASPAETADGQVVWDSDGNFLTIGDGTSRQTFFPVDDATSNPLAIGSVADGTEPSFARKDHVHPTGAGTPATQAFGDAAATGSGPAAAMTDHKHAMPAAPTAASVGAVSVVGGGLETAYAVGATSTTETIDISTGNVQTFTVDANCVFTMPSGLTSGKAISFTAILTDSGGPRNITFTGVKWSGGTEPTVMSGAGAIDIFTFLTIDGGTTWYGFTGGTGMAT